MFQQTLARSESCNVGSWSLAAGFHAAVLAAITAGSFLALRPIREPDVPDVIVFQLEPPPPPREHAPVAAAAAPKGGRDERAFTPPPPADPRPPEKPPVVSEPVETPSRLDTPSAEPAPDGSSTGGAPGVPGGTGERTGSGTGSGPGDSVGDGTGGPLVVGGEVIPPRLLLKVTPDYPDVARRARLEGHVSLTIVIGPDGSVETVDVVRATSALFTAPAVEAVRRWRYTPATLRERPVRVFYSVEVSFVLR